MHIEKQYILWSVDTMNVSKKKFFGLTLLGVAIDILYSLSYANSAKFQQVYTQIGDAFMTVD
mgnify:CR=1 FL=1